MPWKPGACPSLSTESLERRSVLATWIIVGLPDKVDSTVMPRWGEIGKQKIEDAGPLYPKRMETVDDEIRNLAIKFIDKARRTTSPSSSGSTHPHAHRRSPLPEV